MRRSIIPADFSAFLPIFVAFFILRVTAVFLRVLGRLAFAEET
jgi:hypothetical protein